MGHDFLKKNSLILFSKTTWLSSCSGLLEVEEGLSLLESFNGDSLLGCVSFPTSLVSFDFVEAVQESVPLDATLEAAPFFVTLFIIFLDLEFEDLVFPPFARIEATFSNHKSSPLDSFS